MSQQSPLVQLEPPPTAIKAQKHSTGGLLYGQNGLGQVISTNTEPSSRHGGYVPRGGGPVTPKPAPLPKGPRRMNAL